MLSKNPSILKFLDIRCGRKPKNVLESKTHAIKDIIGPWFKVTKKYFSLIQSHEKAIKRLYYLDKNILWKKIIFTVAGN